MFHLNKIYILITHFKLLIVFIVVKPHLKCHVFSPVEMSLLVLIKDIKQTATNQFISHRVEELGLNSSGLTNTGFIALSCAIARF